MCVFLRRLECTLCLHVNIWVYLFLDRSTMLCCEQRKIGTQGFFQFMLFSRTVILKSSTAVVLWDLSSLATYKSFFFSDDHVTLFCVSLLFVLSQHLSPLFLVSDFPFCVQPLDLFPLSLSRSLTVRKKTPLP